MADGWVKLHTKLLDSRVFANEGLLKVWIYCLCRANRGKAFVPITTGRGKTDVELSPGQFIFGRNSAAQKLGMSSSTVWKRMNKLKNMRNVDIKSNSHYSVVTICNWEAYQHVPNEKEQVKEQPSNRQVTGKEQPSNTDKSKESNKRNKSNGRFAPPSKKEVAEYFKERGNMIASDIPLEAENFINHYETEGWENRSGKKITEWKRQASTWDNNYQKYNSKRLKNNAGNETLPQYLTNKL